MQPTRDNIQAALIRDGGPTSDFDLNPGGPRIAPTKEAAVLIPILVTDNGLQLILTKRAAHLKAHPGQIAFPGGRKDDVDRDLVMTALREADEEIGLPAGHVCILGQLPPHATVTSFTVTPVVGWIEKIWDIKTDPGEVADVFQVPLNYVLDPDNYVVQSRRWMGAERFYYTIPYGPYYIWGATARILRSMAARWVE